MKYLDAVGASCSGLCICHCLLTQLLLGSSFLGGGMLFIESEWIHRLLLVPVVLLALMAVLSLYRIRSGGALMILVILGLGVMVSAITLEYRFGESFEQIATVLGGILLIAFHLINRRRLLLASAAQQPK